MKEIRMTEEKKTRTRKYPRLWQEYIWWRECMKGRIARSNRIDRIEEGKCKLDLDRELAIQVIMGYAMHEELAYDTMVSAAKEVPIWDWLNEHKGIGPAIAAKLEALIDDISMFDTPAKLRRFAGLAVFNGRAERRNSVHYCRALKAALVGKKGVAQQFVISSTPWYRELYDGYKEKQRRQHPVTECKQCGIPWDECEGQKQEKKDKVSDSERKHKMAYNDGHINRMALRYIAGKFIVRLWNEWRRIEGLEVPAVEHPLHSL
jgi:hypothetical protein